MKLLEIEKPDPVVLVSGNVYNAKTKQPLSASLVYETLPDGVIAGNGLSSPGDGAFQIVLPYDKNYLIRASADHFFAQSENLNLDSLIRAGNKEIHKNLTDSKGSDEYNIKLSHNRANPVMQYILSKGISPERVSFKGYGETVPFATNDNDEGRQLNRRVEFKILTN